METKQKWVKENGVFYPKSGDTTLHTTPGNGIFQIDDSQGSSPGQLGLRKIADKFTFNFKIYNLEFEDTIQKIKNTWDSNIFVKGNKNLGVIFNGLKGTGKTIAAKILSNEIGLPVIIVNNASEGLLNFIQELCFECIILIDEAEKTFENNSDMLLKMIDGIYNETRKLYILTTNELSLDVNLLGRPGRIRYIKHFDNLTADNIAEYIKDNLIDHSKKEMILNVVDKLEISTIDILQSIIDEVNIHGTIDENTLLNIPTAKYIINIIKFNNVPTYRFNELKTFIKERIPNDESLEMWLNHQTKGLLTNQGVINTEFNAFCCFETISSSNPKLMEKTETSIGVVTNSPDEDGFFTISSNFSDNEEICCIRSYHDTPSLYKGKLRMLHL